MQRHKASFRLYWSQSLQNIKGIESELARPAVSFSLSNHSVKLNWKRSFESVSANVWQRYDDLWIYDDDSVFKFTYREALVQMRRNKYGMVCGITYDKV